MCQWRDIPHVVGRVSYHILAKQHLALNASNSAPDRLGPCLPGTGICPTQRATRVLPDTIMVNNNPR